MIKLERSPKNPILEPNITNPWEHDGAFNGCVVEVNGIYHMVYRALSSDKQQNGISMRVSTVGYATSSDGVTFGEHQQLFEPTEEWEIYGCEDPRITYFNGKFYIFYTALSVFPFSARGIKTAVAITKDFKKFEKHPVSTFNAKAMALFPEKVNGKMAALITINTDMPPAKITLATFEKEADIWSPYFWEEWFDNVNSHTLHLLRDLRDQIELGSPPIKTKDGWLVIYSYIGNYRSDNDKHFGIEAVLLDLKDPKIIIGRTDYSLISPEKAYEMQGDVPNIVFPSGALIHDEQLFVYYGAADTRVALATCNLNDLLKELKPKKHEATKPEENKLQRFKDNPILTPAMELGWQTMGVFNPTAITLDNKIHILYRGQSRDGVSVVGYAMSRDGFHIDENLDEPIYFPRETFELKAQEHCNSGCEDPRITQLDDRLYLTYTAYDGVNPPRVAMSSISVADFLKKEWNWDLPKLISHVGIDDKDACLVKGKIPGTYLAFHRMNGDIWLDVTNHKDFDEENCIAGKILARPRGEKWDNVKIGISGPPLITQKGWLLLYHGISDPGHEYKVGAMLLDFDDPYTILARTEEPIFEPQTEYEKIGIVPNVVFPCGAIIKDETLFVYYGGADFVTGVATMPLKKLFALLA